MKLKMSVLLFVISATVSDFAIAADSDDTTSIMQCVADNKEEGVAHEVVKKYCECINSKKSNSQAQSENQKKDADECRAKVGWQ